MDEGASGNERLLYAARTDNIELLTEVFEKPGSFDINHADGLGKTALHYAVERASESVLNHILCHEECDVDPINKIDHDTPLHLAVKLEDPEVRAYIVELLLEAGADYKLKNKYGQTAEDLVKADDDDVLSLFRQFQAEADIGNGDIAYDDDDDVADESD